MVKPPVVIVVRQIIMMSLLAPLRHGKAHWRCGPAFLTSLPYLQGWFTWEEV